MKPISYSKESVKQINNYFVHNVDKLFRMHGGLASDLIKVEDNTAYLKVVLDNRWKKDPEETAAQLVASRCRFDSRVHPVNLWKVAVYDKRTSSHQAIGEATHTKTHTFIFIVFYHNIN